ncbi:hypothetical protein [Nitrospirillum iridis]|uniref:Uncharacterized protein n=1 Tax=Nitrospirillum iridis TaxID=765888 RepID=A0A7X0EER6_9PROT|nr:hypothetical protein [Nitrospirillum iridis]MBB6253305.1 hypothetical protein [Nitrospirillum iridis]
MPQGPGRAGSGVIVPGTAGDTPDIQVQEDRMLEGQQLDVGMAVTVYGASRRPPRREGDKASTPVLPHVIAPPVTEH